VADLSKLTPQHLIPEGTTSADLKAKVAEAQASATPASPEDDRKARMRERVYTFPFRFVDGNGKILEGTFTNTVPDMRTRTTIGVLRAQLSGGMDYDALDPSTKELTLILSHLTYSLDEKARPEWSRDLLKLHNPALLRALWEEVATHEATFLGL
jgi:hypothetical protein